MLLHVHRHHRADGRDSLAILPIQGTTLQVLVTAGVDGFPELIGLGRPLHHGRPHHEVPTIESWILRSHRSSNYLSRSRVLRQLLGLLIVRHDLPLLGDQPCSDINCWPRSDAKYFLTTATTDDERRSKALDSRLIKASKNSYLRRAYVHRPEQYNSRTYTTEG